MKKNLSAAPSPRFLTAASGGAARRPRTSVLLSRRLMSTPGGGGVGGTGTYVERATALGVRSFARVKKTNRADLVYYATPDVQ